MLPYPVLAMLINISGLMSIIYLSFLIIFVYHKYPYSRCLVHFIISLIVLIFSLFCYSKAGYTIISWG